MKTPYLLRCAGVAVILTLLFRFSLSYFIEHQMSVATIALAIMYGAAMFLTGWYFGKKDVEYLSRANLGWRYHLATYIIFFAVSYLWFFLGFQSKYENIRVINWTAGWWGVFLLMHLTVYLLNRKNTIDGLDKSDLFE